MQLVAQVLAALSALENLAQILLLAEEVPCPARCFSGREAHLYLSRASAAPALEAGVWEACIDGLDEAFAEERGAKGKKTRRNLHAASVPARGQKQKGPAQGGLYGILAGMDA